MVSFDRGQFADSRGAKNGVTLLGNEYFCNAEEGQNKAAEWVGYTFPDP